ncbi:PLP-dependent aminotransferase family protein [Burkholderia guangdongensis]|uniref:aminotransferase-like domain-containing protein n=1 Tax=Burkholderia guangdongensis TaxID=1792500 RepID=UPI0015C974D8|nr:PLP-dependent aminotransferase family protein [Burkholderia guangdongensis]
MKPVLMLDPQSETSLVQQIVTGLAAMVDDKRWRPGVRVPSIRAFAEAHRVSTFTVVEAYDRLVAQGVLMARRGSGFYVAERNRNDVRPAIEKLDEKFTNGWSIRNVLERAEGTIHAGSGSIPEGWLDVDGIARALRQLAARPQALLGSGHAKGYEPLREQIVRQLAEHEIEASPSGIVTTLGANQALDLAVRHLTREGDVVLVDEPGYSDLLVGLRLRRVKTVGIPMTPAGPDVPAMERAFETHRPKVFFTNTRLHNPTGASYSSATAFKVLKLAERYDCIIVEDDVSASLVSGNSVALASMDQLKRVVYIGSFSKTVGPGLRVGFVAADPALLEGLLYHKLVSGMATPTVTEQLVHAVLSEGHFRKQTEQLRDRLAAAQERTCRRLESIGFEVFCEPRAGMFVWARPAGLHCDSAELAMRAVDSRIFLAPGSFFYADAPESGWLRFNVAHCNFDRLFGFLEEAVGG